MLELPRIMLTLKLVHIFAVVLFLGNITVGLFWKRYGDRSGNPAIMAHTTRGIIAADRFLTVPSIVVLIAAGLWLASIEQIPILRTGWLLGAIALFILSGIAFIPLTRVQMLLADTAATGLQSAQEKERYEKLSRQWNTWGTISLLLALAALVLMVLKPVLPAF